MRSASLPVATVPKASLPKYSAGLAVPETIQGRDLAPLYLTTLPPAWRTGW